MTGNAEAVRYEETNAPGKRGAAVELAFFMAFIAALYYYAPASITVGTVVIPARVPFLFIFSWVSLRKRNMGWQNVGLQTPHSWRDTILLGASLGVGLQILVILAVGPIVRQITGASQNLDLFSNMANGNIGTLLGWLVVSWTLAAFGEELIYRGYLMNRVVDLIGSTTSGWAISLLAVSLLFGLVHSYQGINGVIINGFTGLMQGLLYLATRRKLWTGIICHGVIDSLGFILIYILLQCCEGVLQ